LVEENDTLRRLIIRLYDVGLVSGLFGPWSDEWTDEDRDLWEKLDDWKRELGVD
jgi:hypothetical protein